MKVKGTAIQTIPLFIKEKYGEEGFQQWLSNLTAEAREIYSYPILSTNWFSAKQDLVDPVQKVCELFYGGSLRGAWESGRFSAEHGLKGIYKIFVRIGSVQFMVNKATTILPTFYDPCQLEVQEFAGNAAVLHITEFPHAETILENRIGGWIERALEISGCRDVKVDISKALSKGDTVTEYRMNWQ